MAKPDSGSASTSRLGGILSRLTRRDSGSRGLEIMVDADDIVEIWPRFPELDPSVSASRESLPPELLVVGQRQLSRLGSALESAGQSLAGSLKAPIKQLATAWARAEQPDPWPAVAETLVAGIGLGCAVPRLVSWRRPAAFAVDYADQAWQSVETRPPFLRLSYLPGSGSAGLALLTSRAWPTADNLIPAARNRDFALIFADYEDRNSQLSGHGLTGPALVNAGVCQRRGTSAQLRMTLAVPSINRDDLVRVSESWDDLLHAAVDAVDALRAQLERAAGQFLVGGEQPDQLDAAYFVLADLAYGHLRHQGGLPGTAGAGSSVPKARKVRAAVLEQPHQIWEWLCANR